MHMMGIATCVCTPFVFCSRCQFAYFAGMIVYSGECDLLFIQTCRCIRMCVQVTCQRAGAVLYFFCFS